MPNGEKHDLRNGNAFGSKTLEFMGNKTGRKWMVNRMEGGIQEIITGVLGKLYIKCCMVLKHCEFFESLKCTL